MEFAKGGVAIFINRANALFGHCLPAPMTMPSIDFRIRGVAAGKAYSEQNRLSFSPTLMRENILEFLEDTIPHEVAHLVTRKLHGRRVKSHGPEWQAVMRAFGCEPSRCHSYDVSNVATRRDLPAVYCDCQGSAGEHRISKARYKLIGKSGYSIRCRLCKATIRKTRDRSASQEPAPPQSARVMRMPTATSAQRRPAAGHRCEKCHRSISLAVVEYCKANAKRFGGRLLCFEHQRAS